METSVLSTRPTRENEESVSKSRALIDITNGSPIVGLATGSLKTPSSRCSKRMIIPNCPGSGESLLRGQVKTLLQKVEEEAEEKMVCFRPNPFIRNLLINSPIVPPTPANTPQILNGAPNQESETEENEITRSLFMDFSDSSAWSVKVNPSTSNVDELCDGISNISVNNKTKFTGKHIRFVYNSDEELEGELVAEEEEESKTESILVTPKAKVLMFTEAVSEEESWSF